MQITETKTYGLVVIIKSRPASENHEALCDNFSTGRADNLIIKTNTYYQEDPRILIALQIATTWWEFIG